MATDNAHPTSLLVDESRTQSSNSTLSLLVVGVFLTTLGLVSLSFQWRRRKSALQRRGEQQQEEPHAKPTPKGSFSTAKFGGEIRSKHNQEYQEMAAQLNDMKQMQSDVKSQLAGLQVLASRLAEKKTSINGSTGNDNQTNPSRLEKQD